MSCFSFFLRGWGVGGLVGSRLEGTRDVHIKT